MVSFKITGFLKEWLKNHIQVTDQKYSDFFIDNGIKQPSLHLFNGFL